MAFLYTAVYNVYLFLNTVIRGTKVVCTVTG